MTINLVSYCFFPSVALFILMSRLKIKLYIIVIVIVIVIVLLRLGFSGIMISQSLPAYTFSLVSLYCVLYLSIITVYSSCLSEKNKLNCILYLTSELQRFLTRFGTANYTGWNI